MNWRLWIENQALAKNDQNTNGQNFRYLSSSFNIFGRWLSPKSWSFWQISDSLQGKFTTNIGAQIMWVKREAGSQKTFKGMIIIIFHTQIQIHIVDTDTNTNTIQTQIQIQIWCTNYVGKREASSQKTFKGIIIIIFHIQIQMQLVHTNTDLDTIQIEI